MNPLVKGFFKGAGMFLKRHGKTILKIGAAGGVVGVGYLSAKASPEAKARMDDLKEQYPEKVPVKEIVKEVVPVYIPTVVAAAGTIGCIFGLDYVHAKENLLLTTLYSSAEVALNEYKDSVKTTYGEEGEEVVRKTIVEKHVEDDPFSEEKVLITGHGNQLFRDEFNGRYFWSTVLEVKQAVVGVNKKLRSEGSAVVDDFFDILGLPPTKHGSLFGWMACDNLDDDIDVVFDYTSIPTGESCIAINFSRYFEPKYYSSGLY